MTENERSGRHLSLNERLLFESGSPGRRGYETPVEDFDRAPLSELIDPELTRDSVEGMPELAESEVVRHFTRLSTWNYHIDLGLYPLGSCTMKYNPKVNERIARFPGFANIHPYLPEELVQGALAVQKLLEDLLAEITGMKRVTLQTRRGRPRRTHRTADDPRLARVPGTAPKVHSCPGFGAWHKPRQHRHFWISNGQYPVDPQRDARPGCGTAERERRRRRNHDHQPEHVGHL